MERNIQIGDGSVPDRWKDGREIEIKPFGITYEQLKQIAPFAPKNADVFVPYLNTTMQTYEIDTPLRQAMFLAQLAHESGSFRYVREIASGKAYEGRKDLGNTEQGDGVKFKGRGLIQITGKSNYMRVSKDLFGDEQKLLKDPLLLETPQYATLSAGWYWDWKHLNVKADKGDVTGVTKVINGGTNGLQDRINFYTKALKALTP